MSFQGKCRSDHYKNRKGDHDLGEVFFKLRVFLNILLIRKKVFSYSSHRIETHLNVVVEVLEVDISVAF